MIIRLEALTAEAFRPFGDVLETQDLVPQEINQGNTQKFADLAEITIGEGGRTLFSIYRSRAIELPFRIRMMERHPLASQLFYPLQTQPFPIVVAPAEASPDSNNIRAFLSNGQQGINLHPGVWHHYQLTLQQASDYIVVDCGGVGDNCEEHVLKEELFLQL